MRARELVKLKQQCDGRSHVQRGSEKDVELRDRFWQRHDLSRRIGVLGNQNSLCETYYFSGIFGVFCPLA